MTDSTQPPANLPTTADAAKPAEPSSKLFSNLDLNGVVPSRGRPELSEWGPQGVPTTGGKRFVRDLVLAVFGLTLAIVIVMWWVWARTVGGLG